MRKRVLSGLLSLAILLTLMPTAAFASTSPLGGTETVVQPMGSPGPSPGEESDGLPNESEDRDPVIFSEGEDEGEQPAPGEEEGVQPAPGEEEGERPAPSEEEGVQSAPSEGEGEQPALSEDEDEESALNENEVKKPQLSEEGKPIPVPVEPVKIEQAVPELNMMPAPQAIENPCDENVTWTLENGVLTISGEGAMADYTTASGEEAPWYVQRESITAIEIQTGVTAIGEYAFRQCSQAVSVSIPETVTEIGAYAFWACAALKEISFPSRLEKIPVAACKGCKNLTSVEIPEQVTVISGEAFNYCENLSSVTFEGQKLEKIVSMAFSNCALTSVTIPASVTSIDMYAFKNNGLTSVTFEGTPQTIHNAAFKDCPSLKTVYVPESAAVFSAITSGTKYVLESGVTLGQDGNPVKDGYTFIGWTVDESGFQTAQWEENVQEIGGQFGKGLTWSLKNGQLTISGSGSMDGIYLEMDVPWKDYKSEITSIVVEEGVTKLCSKSFTNCENLTSV